MKTALVLSAGGMFGAYQAGAWKALAPVFRPDLVVGASIGAVNGWAIAGECPPELLIETWLNLETLSTYRWRFPRRLSQGFLDSAPAERLIEEVYCRFRPKTDYAMVMTDTLRLRPIIVREADVSSNHLAASAAVLAFFSQHRIGGRLYSDGGLLGALPLWAAAQLGADRIIAVNALPRLPNSAIRGFVGALKGVARFRPRVPPALEVIQIAAPGALGSAKEMLYWSRANTERWIHQGEQDAMAAIASGKIAGVPA